MNDSEFIRILASIVLQATPLTIAVCGETITERAGVVNLSIDGTMLLSAMAGFIAALESQSVWIGFLVAAIVGALFAEAFDKRCSTFDGAACDDKGAFAHLVGY